MKSFAAETLKVASNSLYTINRLSLKAFETASLKELIFMIVNDTIHLITYDKALLWDLRKIEKPQIIGISGEPSVNKDAPIIEDWKQNLKKLSDKTKPGLIKNLAPERKEQKLQTSTTVLWFPIFYENELLLGLWIEYTETKKNKYPYELMNIAMDMLMPAYGAAWMRHTSKLKKRLFHMRKWYYLGGFVLLFLMLSFIKIPQRIVAPCEVVSKNPLIISAPITGIVKEILVKPGQTVQPDDVLLEYDKNVPLQELKIAQKEVEILKSELKKAFALGLENSEYRKNYNVVALKLAREKEELKLAKFRTTQLTVKAKENGIISLDNPDKWRGRPVSIGEKILTITKLDETKIRFWIPEKDNLDSFDESVKIILNVTPNISYTAKLLSIADEAILTEQQIPVFQAEAEWVNFPQNKNLGLKGSAILYGKKVSILFFLFRKPWITIRNLLGI